MGHNDDISPQETTPLPATIELSRLIREEVRAVVREEVLAPTSEPEPPSYDSTSRLLATDAVNIRSESLDGSVDDAPLQDAEGPKPSPPMTLSGIPHWLRVAIRVVPFLAVFITTLVMGKPGRDPLSLSVAALILTVCAYATVLLPGMFIVAVTRTGTEKSSKDEEQQTLEENKEKTQDSDSFSYFISYHFFFTYLVFGLILWIWFAAREDSLFATHQLAEKFNAKIDKPDALSKLMACFDEVVPCRNVTMQDFTHCLIRLGIDPGH